jgi:hypothetical protein
MKLQTHLAVLALSGISLLAGCRSNETITPPPKVASARDRDRYGAGSLVYSEGFSTGAV